MPPVKLDKRERVATPNFNTADRSIGEALLNALGTVHQASKDATRVAGTMMDTEAQNKLNDTKRDLIEEERELARVTTLLSNPSLTPGESMAIHGESRWAMSQIAALNKTGELKAQAVYGDMSVAMEDAPDTVRAREILQEYMGKALEGEEDPAIRDGVIQRFADVAPKFLEKAAVSRVARHNQDKHIKRDLLFTSTLGENPDNFVETLHGEVMTEFGDGGDWTKAVDAGIESLSNFYDEGDTFQGPLNPHEGTVLDALDDIIGTELSMDAGNKKRALALRDSIHANMERRVSSQSSVEDDERDEAFSQAETEAMLLRNAGKVVPQDIYNTMVANAHTTTQKIRLTDLANNLDAPGMSGTAESREVRANMRSVIGVDPNAENWDGEKLRTATSFYDKGVRRLAQIADNAERYEALDALAKKAIDEGTEWSLRQADAENAWNAQQAEREQTLDRLLELNAPLEQIDEMLDSVYDATWLQYQKKDYNRRLDQWARSNGVALADLDI